MHLYKIKIMSKSKNMKFKTTAEDELFGNSIDELTKEEHNIPESTTPVNTVGSLRCMNLLAVNTKLPDIEQEEENITNSPHADIFNSLLKKVVCIDFHGILKTSILKDKNFVYAVVKEVLKIAEQNGNPLFLYQGSCYLYNGHYYQPLEPRDIVTLLSKSAVKMGVPEWDACYYTFQQQLLKQFYSTVPTKPVFHNEDEVVINLENVTIAFSDNDFKISEHSKEHFITYRLPFSYDPTAIAEKFQNYLNRVVPDEALQMILAEFLAYPLIPGLKLEKVLVLFGGGANGKSVFFDVATGLFGKNNVSNYSLQSLTDKSGYQRADLRNKLINYASEISSSLNTAIFKQLASGEPLGVRAIYQPPVTLSNYAKLIFNSNELPESENTEAFFRRILLVPFNVTISPEERDAELAKKIVASELPGIFNWVLAGMQRLLTQRRFTYSDITDKMLEQYKNESDTVRIYLNENELNPHPKEKQLLKTLYENYRSQCLKDGYRPVNKGAFRKSIEKIGYIIERRNSGNMVFIGKTEGGEKV